MEIKPLESVETFGDTLGKLVGLFDAGTNVYLSAQERLAALNKIDAETVKDAAPSVCAPGTTVSNAGSQDEVKQILQRGSTILIIVGILVVVLFAMNLKRR